MQIIQPTTSEDPNTNVALNTFGALASLNQSISQMAGQSCAAARIRAAMALQEPDGYLGAYRPGDNRQEDFNAWGCHIFYNAMLLEILLWADNRIKRLNHLEMTKQDPWVPGTCLSL